MKVQLDDDRCDRRRKGEKEVRMLEVVKVNAGQGGDGVPFWENRFAALARVHSLR